MVAGAAAEVAGDRLADLFVGRVGSSRSSACAVRRMPGVQKPHWSPCCAQNASWIGWRLGALPRGSGAGARPSTVVIAAPSACTARTRQLRTGLAVQSTVHAPHTPCSQPTCVPVRSSASRRKSASEVRGSASPLVARRRSRTGRAARRGHAALRHRPSAAASARSARTAATRRRYSAVAWMSRGRAQAGRRRPRRLGQPRGRRARRPTAPPRRRRRAPAWGPRRTRPGARGRRARRRRGRSSATAPTSAKSPWRRATSMKPQPAPAGGSGEPRLHRELVGSSDVVSGPR